MNKISFCYFCKKEKEKGQFITHTIYLSRQKRQRQQSRIVKVFRCEDCFKKDFTLNQYDRDRASGYMLVEKGRYNNKRKGDA